MPLHTNLFIETNPAPVKYALSLLGKCADTCGCRWCRRARRRVRCARPWCMPADQLEWLIGPVFDVTATIDRYVPVRETEGSMLKNSKNSRCAATSSISPSP
jgi:hypothetical protein